MTVAAIGLVASLLTIADAPFGKLEVTVPEFAARDFSIADFGAKPDGSKCTDAFAAAFAAAEAAGGGRVVVPKGSWLTGAVRFRNNCNLHLDEGATLEFTDDPADYPEVFTTWEGIECYNYSPLIYAIGVTNVAITGKGTIRLSVEQNASVSNCNDACERLRMVAGEKGYEVTELIVTGGCVRISYVLHPTAESFIRCQLALPLDRPWNGRFWGMGNGGGAGSVNVDLAFAAKGNAVAHTDMGTSRGVFGKREVVRDFGWRATHLMTVSGKDLTSAFFGRPPRHSYFSGGSTGGGQGFHEALRFPDDYDGILSYVPANTRLPLHVYFAWNMRLMKYPDGRDVFSKEELAAVEQAAIDWFADKDAPSARGKYLTDTGYSPVTEKAVLELAAKRVPSLCEGDKLNRLHRMFTGPVLGGRTVHAGVPFSASLRNAAGNQWMLRWYLGPDRDLESVTDEELVQWMKSWGPDCDACGDGYAKFAGRGGKMIVVGGLEDSVVPTPSMVEWYGRAARECGGVEHLLKSCRLFLLPGRAHGQGRGCGNVQNDIGILVDWVESGVAPEEVASPLRCGGVLSVKHFVPADICQK